MPDKICLLAIWRLGAPVCNSVLTSSGLVCVYLSLNNSRGLVSWLSLGVHCSSDLPISFQVSNVLQHTNLIFLFMASEAGPLTGASMRARFLPACLKITDTNNSGAGKSDLAWLAGWNRHGYFFLQSFLLY